jgi:hypothetical protein
LRPGFFPFAVAATAVLALNNLLAALGLWSLGRIAIPIAALGLLAVALVLWWRAG